MKLSKVFQDTYNNEKIFLVLNQGIFTKEISEVL